MIPINETDNFSGFLDSVSVLVVKKLAQPATKPKKQKAKKKSIDRNASANGNLESKSHGQDEDELREFIEYLSEEIFTNLPGDLRTISYAVTQDNSAIAEGYALPLDSKIIESVSKTLPPSISDSLCSYGLIDDASDLDRFLDPILSSYLTVATAAPPEFTPAIASSRPPGCEICGREHVPLTYHHLIPRQVHGKAVKRGWHKEWELNKVAWLCRACHSYVHQIASNEELAKEYYDVERLLSREDVQRFAAWVGRVRWKAR